MKLVVNNIQKSFGDKKVLDGINLEVSSGQALGLLGRNGAGKTTTIRIIMHVFEPDWGNVLIDGKEYDTENTVIGYMPEERGMYPKKKILEQLIYFAALKGVPKNKAKENAYRLLERLEMTGFADKKLETLSKGNQQKVQLVATLIADPEIIILDEPFSGLDPVNAMLLEDIVKELLDDGKIVIFSSHQMNYIEEFCRNIAILNKGKIAVSGSVKDIKRAHERNDVLISSVHAEKIYECIKQLPGLYKDISLDGSDIRVKLNRESDKEKLLSAFAMAETDIDEFRVLEPTLEDIFVEYTEGGI